VAALGRSLPDPRVRPPRQADPTPPTGIHATLDNGLSNARIEANNTHLRVLTRQGYGYHSAEALIAMAMLRRGGLCPPLPGRALTT
jgi:hypothetical protein